MNDMFDELINSIKQWKDNNGKTNEEEIKKITSKIAQIRAIEKSDLNAVHQRSTCQTIGINNDPLHTPATGHPGIVTLGK